MSRKCCKNCPQWTPGVAMQCQNDCFDYIVENCINSIARIELKKERKKNSFMWEIRSKRTDGQIKDSRAKCAEG